MSGAPSSQLTGLAQARQSLTDLKARQATERSNFWEQHQASCKALQAQQLVVLQQEWLNLEQACTDLDNQAGAQERLLHEERHMLEAEKAAMRTAGSLGEIVELNVGGTLMTTTRSTLQQVEESMLAVMFSDRWAGSHKRDDNGRIFLNYNPHCFDKILRCLRSKAIEHQHQPMVPSSIDTEHKADYFSLLAHLGLLECMGYYAEESMHFSEGICVNLVGDIKTVEAPPSPEGACTAAPEMLADQVHFFKCAVLTDAWVFLGVNQAARLQCDNRIHTTSYGWSTFSQYQAGKRTTTGTTHWRQGDAVLFKLDLIGYTMSMCSPSHPNPISIPMVRNDRNGFVFFVSFSAPGRSGQEAQQVQLLKVLPEDFGRFD